MAIQLEIPIGDIVDRATILYIKMQKLPVGNSLNNVTKQYAYIANMWKEHYNQDIQDCSFFGLLFMVNCQLWELEDEIRLFETNQDFNQDFIRVARQIYRSNDQRADIKRDINLLYKSNFIEEKYFKEEK